MRALVAGMRGSSLLAEGARPRARGRMRHCSVMLLCVHEMLFQLRHAHNEFVGAKNESRARRGAGAARGRYSVFCVIS